jgi:hypothetical protein
MDEVPARRHVEAHAKAVVEGDMGAIEADFIPALRGNISDLSNKMPRPTTDADVEKFEMKDDHALVRIRYFNDDESLTIRTRWEKHDGRPMIVEAKPADDEPLGAPLEDG